MSLNIFTCGVRLTAFLLWCGAAVVAAWGLRTDPELEIGENRILSPPLQPLTSLPEFVTLEQMASFTERRLRAPLYDPPPPPAVVKPAPPPLKLSFKLIGTVVEGNQSRALLEGANGEIEIRAVGETITLQAGGLVLEQVAADQVFLKSPSQRNPLILSLDSGEGM